MADTTGADTAEADEASADSTSMRVFEPDYFAAFAPQSAMDMVAQTPGFSIRDGDSKRGMGLGGANVLINSRRIPSKTLSAREALDRISAERVVRIELREATEVGLPGLSGQVVNVVTRQDGATARWEWEPELNGASDPQLGRGRIIVSGNAGDWQYNLGLSSYQWAGNSEGPETLYDASGMAVELRAEDERWRGQRHELSGALSSVSESGDISNIGLELATSTEQVNETSARTGVLAPDYLRTYHFSKDGESLKLSGDHEFAMGAGRLKLIGLSASASSGPVSTILTAPLETGAGEAAGAEVIVDRASGESILRGEYSWADSGGDWQMALEGAVNTLDTATSLAALAGDVRIDAPLAGGTSHVEETRTEAALVHGRALGDGVFMQASLAAEYSEIAQTGPNGKVREFVRPKGFLAVSWAPAEDWNASLRLERAVGQLDFGDFISSVNLNDESGQQKSGNPEIVPEQSWDLALEASGELAQLGPVRMKLYGRQIEDVNGSVLFSRVVDANGDVIVSEGPGNLDSAVTYGLDLSGTLPTAGMGVPGGKIDWNASLRDSSIEDPVTGEDRWFSGSQLSRYAVQFRQDLPGTPWAWGLGYESSHRAPGVSITQVSYRSDTPGRVGAFVQHKDLAGMNARLSLSNLADTRESSTRIYHAGTIADPITFVEDRSRKQGLHVGLNLSGSF